jgi:UPF0755 protein
MLLILLLVVGLAILWLGVIKMAHDRFGPPTASLTHFQRWSYGLRLLVAQDDLLTPASFGEEEKGFNIPAGASVTSVAMALESNGLITDWRAFRYYIIYKGFDTAIKAGDFYLSPSMTAIEIADAIQSAYSEVVSFYIYPGWRAEEIAAALPSSGIEVSVEEFLSVVENPSALDLPVFMAGFPSLEGFMFPGEYIIHRQISAQDLALTFVDRFAVSVDPDLQSRLQGNGLNLYQSIILASIIQRETFENNERALIASVFYNRLAAGMKLETDPTVQYSLGFSESWGGWWKTPLALEDLGVNSPYNTYKISGFLQAPSQTQICPLFKLWQPQNKVIFIFSAPTVMLRGPMFFHRLLKNTCRKPVPSVITKIKKKIPSIKNRDFFLSKRQGLFGVIAGTVFVEIIVCLNGRGQVYRLASGQYFGCHQVNVLAIAVLAVISFCKAGSTFWHGLTFSSFGGVRGGNFIFRENRTVRAF